MYGHGRTAQMKELAKNDDENEMGEEEMTFGSRPATAQTDDKSGKKGRNKRLASPSDIGESSMVHMGQVTVDRRNDLIGNAF